MAGINLFGIMNTPAKNYEEGKLKRSNILKNPQKVRVKMFRITLVIGVKVLQIFFFFFKTPNPNCSSHF